jgi:hypothetical protein
MKRLTRTLTAVTLLAVAGAVLFVPAPASATHAPGVHGSLSRSWGNATFSAYRHGWGAYLSVSVSDTARDHDAVYLKAELDVADWVNPTAEVLRVGGAGTTVHTEGVLPAGTGSAIRGIQFTLCRNVDNWFDICIDSAWYTLPQQTAHNTQFRATADALMTASLASFQLQKWLAPQPYDWYDDGCSAPLPAGLENSPSLFVSFKDACERHDFGYRNYGKYRNTLGGPGLQLGPTDGTKAWIDQIFRRDLQAACVAEPTCLSWAELYYQAVRLKAGKAFYAR